MKKYKIIHFTFILVLILFLSNCAPRMITYETFRPPKYDVIKVKTLGVLDLAPYQDQADSGKIIANAIVSKLFPTGFYKLVERSQLERIIRENQFNLSGYVDEKTASEIGKLIGADAVVVGEVTAFNFDDRVETRHETVRVDTGHVRTEYNKHDHKYRKVPVYRDAIVPYKFYTRQGSVAANFRMIRVETGAVLASFTKHFDYSNESRDLGTLPSMDTLYNMGVDKITSEFAQEIAPYRVDVSRPILRAKTTQAKSAYKLARGGLWKEALENWLSATQIRPADAKLFHNIGVSYEVLGDLERAEENYSKALSLDPQNYLYINDVKHIRNQIVEQEKLKKIGL